MAGRTASPLVVGGLSRLQGLSEGDRAQLQQVFEAGHKVKAGAAIRPEGDEPATVSMLLSGCACSYKTLDSGRRQIVGFYFPGDFCDLAGLFIAEIGYGVAALGPCVVARAPSAGLCQLLEHNAAIGSALWRLSLLDAAILREWMVGMGRRSAQAQVAHVLCEVLMRWRAAGHATGSTCPLPMTQADIADALGLSVVQVNKELQRLRASGLIVLSRGLLKIEKAERLAQLGDFSPGYLQMPTSTASDRSTAAA